MKCKAKNSGQILNKKILGHIIGNWHTLLKADNIHGKWNLLYKQGSKHYGIYQKKKPSKQAQANVIHYTFIF